MNNFSVYCYTNKINGKKYIGITSHTLSERAGQAGNRYKQCTRFYNAIKKYGWDVFDPEILFEGLSKAEACLKEQELIAYYRTRDKHFGYNVCTGGEISDGNKGQVFSKERRKHMAEAQRGKRKSDETKEKIRQKSYGNQRQPAVSVVNLTTGERFERVVQAARKYGVDRSNISRACGGQLKTCAGCVWAYEKDLAHPSN